MLRYRGQKPVSNHTMAGEKWPVIQEGQGEAVFKNNRGLFLPTDDTTERARCARMRSVFHFSPFQKERSSVRGKKSPDVLRVDASVGLSTI
jgi:hypothetical protein